MIKCYYHSADLDGLACGAIFRKTFPEAQLIGIDYGESVDIQPGDTVYMADISLPIEEMCRLSLVAKRFVWVDHHGTAIRAFEASQHEHNIESFLREGTAACELLWEYLYPDIAPSDVIRLLGQYDIWNQEWPFNWEKVVLPFQWGMRLRVPSLDKFPERFLSERIEFGTIENIISTGNDIIEYQANQDARLMKGSFVVEFEGLRCLCVNAAGAGSLTFKSVYDPEKHDIMAAFFFDGEKWRVSLRSDKGEVNCGEIAKLYGGGGHPGAAGFASTICPFNRPN